VLLPLLAPRRLCLDLHYDLVIEVRGQVEVQAHGQAELGPRQVAELLEGRFQPAHLPEDHGQFGARLGIAGIDLQRLPAVFLGLGQLPPLRQDHGEAKVQVRVAVALLDGLLELLPRRFRGPLFLQREAELGVSLRGVETAEAVVGIVAVMDGGQRVFEGSRRRLVLLLVEEHDALAIAPHSPAREESPQQRQCSHLRGVVRGPSRSRLTLTVSPDPSPARSDRRNGPRPAGITFSRAASAIPNGRSSRRRESPCDRRTGRRVAHQSMRLRMNVGSSSGLRRPTRRSPPWSSPDSGFLPRGRKRSPGDRLSLSQA